VLEAKPDRIKKKIDVEGIFTNLFEKRKEKK
jgi:hypothetical protein